MYARLRKIDLPALLVRLSGGLALISMPFKTLSDVFYKWLPFDPSHLAHLTALIVGLSLIYLASQLHRKRQSALVITALLLTFLVMIELLHLKNIHLALLYAVILVYLLRQRHQYIVKNDLISLRRSFLVAGILLVATIGFAFYTFERIDQNEYGRELTSLQTLRVTFDAMLGTPLPSSLHPTHKAYSLLFSLQAAVIVAAGIVFFGLFYPVRPGQGSGRLRRRRAETLLAQHGNSSEDYLKIWPHDKHYFFYQDSFLAYGVKHGVAVVIDGAAGNPAQYVGLRQAFIDECWINSWQVAILHANEVEKQAWAALGFNNLYLGSEARIDIATFCQTKIGDKHFRYIKNKAAKDGLTVKEIASPISAAGMSQLRQVSDAWLESGKREYRFFMGYFDASYLRRCRVFAVYEGQRIIAYTNLLPTYRKRDHSIDHMRFRHGVSPATMHFLLLNVLITLHDEGQTTLNLGLSPLSQLDQHTSSLKKGLLTTIRRLGGRYYSFAGLEQFKSKFGPVWEPTYLLYGKVANLAAIGRAVSGLSTYKKPRRFRQ